jgi:hypothetical protein
MSAADATFVPSIKLQPSAPPTNGDALLELDENIVVTRVGGAIADAASDMRKSDGEEAREAARRAAVDIATAALVANSSETAAHSDDVDVITEGIARQLGISGQQLEDVLIAARLHDIGKLGVPVRILNKPDSLNPMEWTAIHRHTIVGEQILLAVPELRGAAHLVRHSHERWDGAGYPDGLAGEEISLGSRIIFCADAFHAIRSDRPYRRGRPAPEALAEIRANAGTQFDPAVVEALVELAGDLRATSNGTRPRSRRAGRLMALMMIVSVGACGSALAHSGLMPKANPDPRPAAGSTVAEPSTTGGLGAAVQSPISLDITKGQATKGQATAGVPTNILEGLSDAGSPTLLSPGTAPVSGPIAFLPALGTAATDQTGTGNGSASSQDGPGVRDHGQGIGHGKGQGKGRGAEQGRGHDKQKSHSAPAAASEGNSGKGKAKGHSGSSGNATTKSSTGSKSDAGSSKKSPTSHSTTKGDSSKASSGSGSGNTKSGNAAGSAQSSAPVKPPKAPKAPKAPKDTPPAPVQSTDTPPVSGSTSGADAGNTNTGKVKGKG